MLKKLLYAAPSVILGVVLLLPKDSVSQGFAPSFSTFSVPVGGKQAISGNWGFNSMAGTASTNSVVNNQTWQVLDINGDHLQDLVVTAQNDASGYDVVFSPTSPYWKVHLNTGSGFTTLINWPVPMGGKQANQGNWGFNSTFGSASTNSVVNNESWSTMDMNGDGKPDLVVTAQNDASGYDKVFGVGASPYWKVYLNTGTGFSSSVTNWPVPAGGKQHATGNWGFNAIAGSASTNSVVNNQTWSTIDMNADGKPDLVVTAQNDASGYDKVFGVGTSPYWNVYLNTGSGFAGSAMTWAVPAGGYQGISGNWGINAIAGSAGGNSVINNQTWSTIDMNADGKPDMVITAQNDASGYDKVFGIGANPHWRVYLNTGSGFSTTQNTWSVPAGGYQGTSGNWGFNALAGSAGGNSVLNNQTWSTLDLNADGQLDLVVTAQNDTSGYDKVFSVGSNPYWKAYYGTGSGFSGTETNWPVPMGGYQGTSGNWGFNAIAGSASGNSVTNNQTWNVADLNNDGKLDLVVTAQNNASGYDTVFDPPGNPYWKIYMNQNLGVDDIENADARISVYPNPSKAVFTVGLTTDATPDAIEVYDLAGRKVLEQKNVQQIDLAFADAGIYLLKIDVNGKSYFRKVVKE
ncbi:MAG TPA: T9SS type A sorting domain-containing protein [Flavobacterium sp.]|jgi:hypothetical protein